MRTRPPTPRHHAGTFGARGGPTAAFDGPRRHPPAHGDRRSHGAPGARARRRARRHPSRGAGEAGERAVSSTDRRPTPIEIPIPNYRFRATVGLQRTEANLTLPALHFTNSLTTVRSSYSFTPNMFVDALSQYDAVSKLFNANIRFNLIHHPLSDLFIVYNDQRMLTPDSPIPGRSLLVKFTQMVSF